MNTNLLDEIHELKLRKNAVLLAHFYQEGAIQDAADFVGDSLELSRKAAQTDADIIVFAGVHFMAETAKILNPSKKVLLPDLSAGCSLADSCPPQDLQKFKDENPETTIVSYINCSAGVKALSDIICTSSNAEKVIESIPKNHRILFAPDKNLGQYLVQKTGRPMQLWPGSCIVHEIFSAKKITQLKVEHPDALVIAHPECEEGVLELADYIGSTSKLLQITQTHDAQKFIVVTESGILHQMKKASPHKQFIAGPPTTNCACNDCPYMKLNTIEKLRNCLRDEAPEIQLNSEIQILAKRPLERMLAL